MSTIRTDNIQSTDNSVNIPVAELARTSDVDERVIYVGSVAELEALPNPIQGQEASVAGSNFAWNGTGWAPLGGVSVKAFGAVGDGAADDSAAIQAAIEYAADGAYPVVFPPGEFFITQSIVIRDPQTHLIGSGFRISHYDGDMVGGSTRIIWGGASTADIFDMKVPAQPSLRNVILENFTIDGGGISGGTLIAISATLANRCSLRNLGIEDVDIGVYLDTACWGWDYQNVHWHNCRQHGVRTEGNTNNHNFFNCRFGNVGLASNPISHVSLNASRQGQNINFYGCNFEGATPPFTMVHIFQALQVGFYGGYFEAQGTVDGTFIRLGDNNYVSGAIISGVFFQGLDNIEYAISTGDVGCEGLVVEGCSFRNLNTAVLQNRGGSANKKCRFGANATDLGITEVFGGINEAQGWDSYAFAQVRINNDAAKELTPPADLSGGVAVGKIEVWARRQPGEGGALLYDAQGASAQTTLLYSTSNFETSTGVLTGTTGGAGKITVSAATDGKVYIENRLGSPLDIIYSFCEPTGYAS